MASQFPDERPPITPAPGGSGLVDRVKNIITAPKAEWPRIDAEAVTERDLFMRYAVPLAAIPAVCGLIGQLAFPPRVFGVVIRLSPGTAIANAVLGYLLGLAALFIMARIVDGLAPTFGARKGVVPATKLVIFASVPIWLAGVGGLIPGLGWIASLVGLGYAIYLMYLGLPVLMKAPADKTVPYLAVVAVIWFVVTLVMGLIVAALAGLFAPSVGTVTFS